MTVEPILIDSDDGSEPEFLFVDSNPSSVASRVKSRGRQNKEQEPGANAQISPSGTHLNGKRGVPEQDGYGEVPKRRKPSKIKRAGPNLEQNAVPQSASNGEDDFAQEPVVCQEEDEKQLEEEEDRRENELVEYVPLPRKVDKKLHLEAYFVGKAIPSSLAKQRWPSRYQKGENALSHFDEAVVDGVHYKIGECVTVNGEGCEHLGKIIEFYKLSGENWFRIQWFFRLSDTSIGTLEDIATDNRRIFSSEVEDDNFLECITGKVKVVQTQPSLSFLKRNKVVPPSCDYYFDMGYSYDFSTFHCVPSENEPNSETSSVCNESASEVQSGGKANACVQERCNPKSELALLDLYSGCGGMSTGLCMGSSLAGIKVVTKWALDLNPFACESLRHNHPETEVRNEDAESFLSLLREWQKLCTKYADCSAVNEPLSPGSDSESSDSQTGVYEVERIVDIRIAGKDVQAKKYETSSKAPKTCLEFKVRWKYYTSDQDTWEPVENLADCEHRIREFVQEGQRKRLLPLPGDVDVICGGPPCQGASGFNRFRNRAAPLECPRNKQMVVYMNIVEFLKPRFVLMENVVDILKFCGGILGRYAMFRLVDMCYQAKLGLMVAGSYGLPQFRMRVFLWGAAPSEKLPPFPLPTHDVIYRGVVPNEFTRNVVKHANNVNLETALVLEDAISDLPSVDNSEKRDEINYDQEPKTAFQSYIRSVKGVFFGDKKQGRNKKLYDHRPLRLNTDDYQRTCRIPKRKGANFRDLGGLKVREDNAIELDLSVEREYLPSGKPLVPDYAISFVKGKSLKPFARLWWDETVPTVVTRAEPHNQPMLHPLQDRVLTIRENARLQGFPDCYKLFGPVKERYTQVGNAVAVPVARALGYSLAQAVTGANGSPLLILPEGFPACHNH